MPGPWVSTAWTAGQTQEEEEQTIMVGSKAAASPTAGCKHREMVKKKGKEKKGENNLGDFKMRKKMDFFFQKVAFARVAQKSWVCHGQMDRQTNATV